MDKLQWFKFTPTDWIMGKIQRCPEITQARFMRLICLYWNKECLLTYEDAEIEIDKEHLDLLIGKKIIKLVDNFISIEFLNEQLENISETSQKRRDAVLQRWAKVKQNDTNVLQVDTSVLQNDTEKSREEETREEKSKKRVVNKFTAPAELEVITYFIENGYNEITAKKAFKYYETGEWKDSSGKQVRNWKQKMQSVWFKDENKILKKSNISDYNQVRGKLS